MVKETPYSYPVPRAVVLEQVSAGSVALVKALWVTGRIKLAFVKTTLTLT